LGSPSPVEANPGGDGANHSLHVFPEAMAPKIHGRVIPHWYRAPVGYLKLLVINNINGFVAFRISSEGTTNQLTVFTRTRRMIQYNRIL